MIISADALAYLAFIILLWPSRAASYFNIKPSANLLFEGDPLIHGNNYGL